MSETPLKFTRVLSVDKTNKTITIDANTTRALSNEDIGSVIFDRTNRCVFIWDGENLENYSESVDAPIERVTLEVRANQSGSIDEYLDGAAFSGLFYYSADTNLVTAAEPDSGDYCDFSIRSYPFYIRITCASNKDAVNIVAAEKYAICFSRSNRRGGASKQAVYLNSTENSDFILKPLVLGSDNCDIYDNVIIVGELGQHCRMIWDPMILLNESLVDITWIDTGGENPTLEQPLVNAMLVGTDWEFNKNSAKRIRRVEINYKLVYIQNIRTQLEDWVKTYPRSLTISSTARAMIKADNATGIIQYPKFISRPLGINLGVGLYRDNKGTFEVASTNTERKTAYQKGIEQISNLVTGSLLCKRRSSGDFYFTYDV